jgi:ABC-2 type transport system permease protein
MIWINHESRELAQRLESSGYFNIAYIPESPQEIQALVDRCKVLCAIQINKGFSSDLKRKTPTEIQIIVDGTDSNTATVAMDYAGRIVMKYAKVRLCLSVKRAKYRLTQLRVQPRS